MLYEHWFLNGGSFSVFHVYWRLSKKTKQLIQTKTLGFISSVPMSQTRIPPMAVKLLICQFTTDSVSSDDKCVVHSQLVMCRAIALKVKHSTFIYLYIYNMVQLNLDLHLNEM